MSVICSLNGGILKNTDMLTELSSVAMHRLNTCVMMRENYLRKLIGAANTDTWTCFSLMNDNGLEINILSELAELVIKIRLALANSQSLPSITHQNRVFGVNNLPIMFCSQLHLPDKQEIPDDVKVHFRSIFWHPPSMI
jgi:hypothetical protein